MKKRKIFVFNGPNLNMLGTREPGMYGTDSLSDLLRMLKRYAKERGVVIRAYQSNHEGRLIDRIHALAGKDIFGIIINPGALTHYSYALRDAIKAVGFPTVEVHLSDIDRREDFRRISVVKDVCIAQINGLGQKGYTQAIDILLKEDSS